jgi:hypothetical protein
MMDSETFLNERIDVLAKFGTGLNPCVPLKFRRANGQEVTVIEIGLRHPTVQGRRAVHVFDVTDGSSDYRIELDSERLTWMLTRMGDSI